MEFVPQNKLDWISKSQSYIIFKVVTKCAYDFRFLFTNNAKMTSLVGDKFVSGMIGTLCDALEAEYGILVTRLYRIFKPLKGMLL